MTALISRRHLIPASLALALFVIFSLPICRAATVIQSISPAQVAVGAPASVTLTVQDDNAHPGNELSGDTVVLPTVSIALPDVEGLESGLTASQIKVSNGAATTTSVFTVKATHAGTFIIPAFDVHTRNGEALHVKAMSLVVTNAGAVQDASVSATSATATLSAGPVVMPPPSAAPPATPPEQDQPPQATSAAPAPDAGPAVPRNADGSPAKVFIVITPETTDAFVGQAVVMSIDFYIQLAVNADQNSLPTIKGSDFLMNSFTTRGHLTNGLMENIPYLRESWVTAISAPKSGDFPLSMERDTYWVKSINTDETSFFASIFNRHANLAHELIPSNLLTMHIRPLPEEGRPEHFTGAIGRFHVTGQAGPVSVSVGDPVHLRFAVSGTGNFDYVRCPALKDDPAWKPYVPTARTNYVNEAHSQAMKIFDQSIIPHKDGNLPLPDASFSYFDPELKRYVTVPLALPVVTVSGSENVAAAVPASAEGPASLTLSPADGDLLPNRTEIGETLASLQPAYRHPWFWGVESGLIMLPIVGAALVYLRLRAQPDEGLTSRALYRRSLEQELAAMDEAARAHNAPAFFLASRHAIQLQLGRRWDVRPEAITLGAIRAREPQLADMLEPLFRQADEAIYSGGNASAVDLADWNRRVRAEMLQPLPA